MADDEVRLRIHVRGGLIAERLINRAMGEQGVEVVSTDLGDSLEEARSTHWITIGYALSVGANVVVVVQGTAVAVKKALAKYREWHPEAKVEVQDESGTRLPGYL
jgi:hypothetical protein